MASREVTYNITPAKVNLTGFKRMNIAMAKTKKTAGRMSRSMVTSFAKVGGKMVTFSAMSVLALTAVTTATIGFSVKSAANAEEVENKFAVAFKGMTDSANSWINSFAKSVGRSRNETKRMLADTQDLMAGFGATKDEAFSFAKQVQTLGVDLASFNNLRDDEAVTKLRKGLMGETEGLKALGIVINQNMLQEEARANGLSDNLRELDELTKMQLRYQIAIRQSGNAVGDARRSLGSLTNQTKAMRSGIKDLSITFGKIFIPKATNVVSFLNTKFADAFTFLSEVLTDPIKTLIKTTSIFFRVMNYLGSSILGVFGIENVSFGDIVLKVVKSITKMLEDMTRFLFDNRIKILRVISNISRGINSFVKFAKTLLNDLLIIFKIVFKYLIEIAPFATNVLNIAFMMIAVTIKFVIEVVRELLEWFVKYEEVMIPLVAGITSATIAFKLIKKGVLVYTAVVKKLKIAIIFLTGAKKAFLVVLAIMLKPITLVIVAIGLLVAAGVLLYRNWDRITEFASKLWTNIKIIFTKIKDFVSNIVEGIGGIIGKMIGWVGNAISKVMEFLGLNKKARNEPIVTPESHRGQRSGARGPSNRPQSKPLSIPGFAKGVKNFIGGSALVGEEGPELVTLPRGSNVIPNNKLSQQVKMVVNVQVDIASFNGDVKKITDSIKQPIKTEVEKMFKQLASELSLGVV